jgi:hypothetical protein
VVKNLKKRASSREDRFPKTLFDLSRCRITQDDGFTDLLSRLWMQVDEWDEQVLAAHQRMRQRPRCIGGLWLFWLLLPWRPHGLVAKINDKRKLQTCEDLGRISVDYSRIRRAPIASPRHVRPSEARRAHACLSPLIHTLASA